MTDFKMPDFTMTDSMMPPKVKGIVHRRQRGWARIFSSHNEAQRRTKSGAVSFRAFPYLRPLER